MRKIFYGCAVSESTHTGIKHLTYNTSTENLAYRIGCPRTGETEQSGTRVPQADESRPILYTEVPANRQ